MYSISTTISLIYTLSLSHCYFLLLFFNVHIKFSFKSIFSWALHNFDIIFYMILFFPSISFINSVNCHLIFFCFESFSILYFWIYDSVCICVCLIYFHMLFWGCLIQFGVLCYSFLLQHDWNLGETFQQLVCLDFHFWGSSAEAPSSITKVCII